MIGLLIVAHGNLGECLIQWATYVLGQRPERLESVDLSGCSGVADMLAADNARIAQLDDGDGVLVLSDMYGATPCNTVCQLIQPGRVEAVTGVSLPMLLKAITYRREPLAKLADLVIRGAHEGSFHIPPGDAHG